MSYAALFGISTGFCFLVWVIVTRLYIWPALRERSRADAVRPILLLHAFRYVGLAFLLPGVVSPQLPASFAQPVAYGDLITAVLALLALAALGSGLESALIWLFNIVGTADILNAFYQGNRISLAQAPGILGATFFLLAVVVPLLLITHVVVFGLMLRKKAAVELHSRPHAA